MTNGLDRTCWPSWRARVERLLQQQEIVVRTREIERLLALGASAFFFRANVRPGVRVIEPGSDAL